MLVVVACVFLALRAAADSGVISSCFDPKPLAPLPKKCPPVDTTDSSHSCGGNADTFLPYFGEYTPLASNVVKVSAKKTEDCSFTSSAEALFDEVDDFTWNASTKDGSNPYVIFQTSLIIPAVVGVKVTGNGKNDPEATLLESSDCFHGPWKKVQQFQIQSTSERQGFALNTSFTTEPKQYWRFTILGAKKRLSYVQDLRLYTRPTANTYSENLASSSTDPSALPAPFRKTDEQGGALAPSQSAPSVYVHGKTTEDEVTVLGWQFNASSAKSGVMYMRVEAVKKPFAQVQVATLMCEFQKDKRVKAGTCLVAPKDQPVAYALYTITASAASPSNSLHQLASTKPPIQLTSLKRISCPKYACPCRLAKQSSDSTSHDTIDCLSGMRACVYAKLAPQTGTTSARKF